MDKYQVLYSGHSPRGHENKISIIMYENEEESFNGRPKWLTFIPDAGTESNAIRTCRLLNEEHREISNRREARARREAVDEMDEN